MTIFCGGENHCTKVQKRKGELYKEAGGKGYGGEKRQKVEYFGVGQSM